MSNQTRKLELVVTSGFRSGDLIAGKYKIEGVLGEGGMGTVFAVRHTQLREMFALKVLLPELAKKPEAAARFLREARASARLKGEHIVRVTDFGTAEGCPYMVMEHLDGQDLGAYQQVKGALPIRDAVEFVAQACEGLAEAHSLGFVHRDLKPSNLYLIRRSNGLPCIKVLDFGISKTPTQNETKGNKNLTTTNSVMGSPMYMPPEQLRSSKDVDPRSDVWALGVVLFELLTDKLPFHSELFTEIMIRILSDPAPPVSEFRTDIPPELVAIVAKCLEKDPRKRYSGAAELMDALEPFRPRPARSSADWSASAGNTLPASVAPKLIEEDESELSMDASTSVYRKKRPAWWPLLAGGVFLAGFGGLSAALSMRGRRPDVLHNIVLRAPVILTSNEPATIPTSEPVVEPTTKKAEIAKTTRSAATAAQPRPKDFGSRK